MTTITNWLVKTVAGLEPTIRHLDASGEQRLVPVEITGHNSFLARDGKEYRLADPDPTYLQASGLPKEKLTWLVITQIQKFHNGGVSA